MAKVQVLNVAVLDNPSPFGNPFQFEITFECMEDLAEGWYHCITAVIIACVKLQHKSVNSYTVLAVVANYFLLKCKG